MVWLNGAFVPQHLSLNRMKVEFSSPLSCCQLSAYDKFAV